LIEKVRFAADSLVEGAVSSEPASEVKFFGESREIRFPIPVGLWIIPGS
jgi:hypothetical protein